METANQLLAEIQKVKVNRNAGRTAAARKPPSSTSTPRPEMADMRPSMDGLHPNMENLSIQDQNTTDYSPYRQPPPPVQRPDDQYQPQPQDVEYAKRLSATPTYQYPSETSTPRPPPGAKYPATFSDPRAISPSSTPQGYDRYAKEIGEFSPGPFNVSPLPFF